MVGRNGIFYDRKGRDWDATITKIIDNPISIRQAFWAPYKKFVRMIEEQVAKRAAAADAAADAKLADGRHGRRQRPTSRAKPAEPPKTRSTSGTVAAIGVVLDAPLLAALGGIFGAIVKLPAAGRCRCAIVGILLLDLRALDDHRLAQAAQAQPRPDPRRQRLGGERQGEDQRAVRRLAHRRGHAAARLRSATWSIRSPRRRAPWPQCHVVVILCWPSAGT